MEKENQSGPAAAEEIVSDSFICCVCLDLLYKPIVLSCGHVSCFWCVHKSMNSMRESHCPFCRHPYNHFPTVCQMLHFLLLKMYPIAYNRREIQIIEEEKKNGYFSPQFDANVCGSHANEEPSHLSDGDSIYSYTASESNSRKRESCRNVDQLESALLIQSITVSERNSDRSRENCCSQEKNISVADVLCPTCKNMLFRPVVFNCGHVHCESCIIGSASEPLRCEVCKSQHPKGIPKVCLELDHFLEQHFPKEYALRRATVELVQVNSKHESPSTCSKETDIKGLPSQEPTGAQLCTWSDPHANVHISIGCDSCGMYPLVGDRYKCIDCEEAVGFDLCGECYNTGSKLPGRFNQQHTPEHRFELMNSDMIRNFMVRWIGSHFGDGSQNAPDRSEWLRAINRAWSETPENSETGTAIYNTLVGLLSDSLESSDNTSPAPRLPGDVLIGLLSDSLENGPVSSILPGTAQASTESNTNPPRVSSTENAQDENDTNPTG